MRHYSEAPECVNRIFPSDSRRPQRSRAKGSRANLQVCTDALRKYGDRNNAKMMNRPGWSQRKMPTKSRGAPPNARWIPRSQTGRRKATGGDD
jgi:hypothetical protein